MIGLTRQAVRAVSAKAVVHSPATTALRVRNAHTHRVSRTATAHTGRSATPSRARIPCSDWLET